MPTFKVFVHDDSVSVACFSETWLNNSIPDQAVSIPGYRLVRNDRAYKRGGGIAIYIRENILSKTVYSTNLTASSICKTECLAVELKISGAVMLVAVIYNPPDNDVSTFMQCELATLLSTYEHCVLTGDLNTDWLRRSTRKERLEEIFTTYTMTVLGTEPTHFYDDGCSQLDLLVTNRPDVVTTFQQVSVPGLSKHDLIFCSCNINTCAIDQHSVETYRDYVNFDPNLLRDSINGISWDIFRNINDVNQLTEYFNSSIMSVHDSCIPLRTVRHRQHYNTWFNDAIRKAIVERDMAYSDWRTAPMEYKDGKKQIYTQLRNRTNALVRRVKSEHINRNIVVAGSTMNLWKMVRGLGIGKVQDQEDCSFDPNMINHHFAGQFTIDNADSYETRRPQPVGGFSFQQIAAHEVLNAFCEVKSNAVGTDEIPTKFLKIILPLIIDHIVHLYNMIIKTLTFPEAWKCAKIIPLRKKKHLNSVENLRPISLLSVLSKVLEKVLKQQISTYFTSMNLLNDDQAGFRRGHGVKTALLRVYDDIAGLIDRKDKVALLLIDFSKAFDTISHCRLLHKLHERFHFSSSAFPLPLGFRKDQCLDLCCSLHTLMTYPEY
ncbi:uncharacterized protein LOC129773455 [Toxorhynchites rutilus septentrionalis]|uniref:uncharacterized protein LOC129773455 n=1 Tax=Toxorhynchites rutilus septentrionalis TaxID=329112 RepID=UPI00247903B7|nr:uncharacterized protein LOC129773455 [Toxorhynchites rutilus septentrionalis]